MNVGLRHPLKDDKPQSSFGQRAVVSTSQNAVRYRARSYRAK